jgi:ribosome biogenesis GTPase
MARRRLSQQQKKRIQDAQDAVHTHSENHLDCLVISHHGGFILVETVDTRLIECKVKSNLGVIVCGDRVICEDTGNDEFRVVAIRPRKNLLQRIDGSGKTRSIAANLSQLMICLAAKPEPNLFLLDQYLLSAAQQKINPVIVFNKTDLLSEPEEDAYHLKSIYRPLGYTVLFISAKFGQGIDRLKSSFDHQTTVLSGVSGVGKSSITRALLPEVKVKIAEISEASEEGRHTTRTSRLYHLPNKGHLIDTPGVRGFNPLIDDSQPVGAGFREIDERAAQCRFSNCKHINEPGCAVIAAVSDHEITDSRYQHYLRLLDQL